MSELDPGRRDADLPRPPGEYPRAEWNPCARWVIAVGLLYSLAEWGWVATLAVVSFAALGVMTVLLARRRGAQRRLPEVADLSVAAALSLTGSLGVIAACEVIGLVMLIGTSPALWGYGRARWLPGGTSTAAWSCCSGSATRAMLEEPCLRRLSPALPDDVSRLDDATLCLAWRRSFLVLERTSCEGEQLAIVERRRRYLDELCRRWPEGTARWLASGARASGNPLPYLGTQPPRPR